MKNLLVVCPLESELGYLLEALAGLGLGVEVRSSLKVPVYVAPGMTIALGGHGKVQFGVQAQYLLSHLGPVDGFVCLGAGGGLDSHLRVGDLVVGEKTIEHDYTEKFDLGARVPEFLADSSLLAKVRKLSSSSFDIHYGSIASGDEDIVDSERAGQLHHATGALAVAWEGSGGARACRFNGTAFLEIRAITDNARDSVPESFSKNLGLCMGNAAQLIYQLSGRTTR